MKTVIHYMPKGVPPASFAEIVADERRTGHTVLVLVPRPPPRAWPSPDQTSRPCRLGSAPLR